MPAVHEVAHAPGTRMVASAKPMMTPSERQVRGSITQDAAARSSVAGYEHSGRPGAVRGNHGVVDVEVCRPGRHRGPDRRGQARSIHVGR